MARKRTKSRSGARKRKQAGPKRRRGRAAAKKNLRRKARPKAAGNAVARAYRAVIDTIKDTDRLRNQLEPPATSETE